MTESYSFQKFIDERKHLDTDELRHTMKPIIHIIDKDFKGKEHLYCDKEQLDSNGKFRRPKIMIEAERRGYDSVSDMMEADKKKDEENKKKEDEQRQNKIKILEENNDILTRHARSVEEAFNEYKKLTDERFDKLAKLLTK